MSKLGILCEKRCFYETLIRLKRLNTAILHTSILQAITSFDVADNSMRKLVDNSMKLFI